MNGSKAPGGGNDLAVLVELQRMIYNISVRMLMNPHDAEDATQEILERILRSYGEFRHESSLETWAYRIAVNYLLNRKKAGLRRREISFELFERDVSAPVEDTAPRFETVVEEKLLTEELKVGCTHAMLQCLSPSQRIVFILGSIFAFPSALASEILGMDDDVYRRRLSRVRNKIRHFMEKNCGLLNPDAVCSCRRRIGVALRRGRIVRGRLVFAGSAEPVREFIDEMNEIDAVSAVYRDGPFLRYSGKTHEDLLRDLAPIVSGADYRILREE